LPGPTSIVAPDTAAATASWIIEKSQPDAQTVSVGGGVFAHAPPAIRTISNVASLMTRSP
jgi:hypothetical protein